MSDDKTTLDDAYRTALTVVARQLQQLQEGHKQILAGMTEVKAELVTHGLTLEQVLREAQRTNGRISALEAWRQQSEADAREAAAFAAGEESVKREYRSKLELVWDRVERPVVYGIGALMVGVGIRVGAWFIAGTW